jgi:hypothetical protein
MEGRPAAIPSQRPAGTPGLLSSLTSFITSRLVDRRFVR